MSNNYLTSNAMVQKVTSKLLQFGHRFGTASLWQAKRQSTERHRLSVNLSALAFLFLVAATSGVVLAFFVWHSGINANDKATLFDMIYGHAYRPYVYRVLIPKIVEGAAYATPDIARTALQNTVAQSSLALRWMDRFHANGLYTEAIYVMLVMYISLIAYAISFKALVRALYDNETYARFASIVAVVAIVPFFSFGYMYDFATLFLSVLILRAMLQPTYVLFILAFLVACLNKETAILFSLIFLVYFWPRMDKKRLFMLAAAQVMIFLIIKTGLTWIYSDNPGEVAEFNLLRHFKEYSHFSWFGVFSLLGWLMSLFSVFSHWHTKPEFLRKSLILIVPLFSLYLFFGWPYEWRVFYEIYPVVVILSLHSLYAYVRGAELAKGELRWAA